MAYQGIDPVAAKRARRPAPVVPSFEKAATEVHRDRMKGWSNGKHVDQWINTLRDHAFPVIGSRPISEIGTPDVLKVLTPTRWFRPEPRPSVQYVGHMATTAARDHRLTPQSKAVLQVLRARCGHGTVTPTCKTTLAHIMGVCTRSIGRYIAELRVHGGADFARERCAIIDHLTTAQNSSCPIGNIYVTI